MAKGWRRAGVGDGAGLGLSLKRCVQRLVEESRHANRGERNSNPDIRCFTVLIVLNAEVVDGQLQLKRFADAIPAQGWTDFHERLSNVIETSRLSLDAV